jgi:hypothetical protein
VFHDSVQAWASFVEWDWHFFYRSYELGKLIDNRDPGTSSGQVRRQAWALRAIAQAGMYGLAAEPHTAEAFQLTNNNLSALADWLAANPTYEGQLLYWNRVRASGWENGYFCGVLQACDAMGYARAAEIVDRMMGSIAGIMLTPDFYPRDCMPYDMGPGGMTDQVLTWAGAKACMIASGYSGGGTAWSSNSFPVSYSGLRGNLTYEASLGSQQAARALAWLLSAATNGPNDPSRGATNAYQQVDPTFFIS